MAFIKKRGPFAQILLDSHCRKCLEEILRRNQAKNRALLGRTCEKQSSSVVHPLKKGSNIFVKMTVWTLAAAVTAAAYSVFTSTTGWHMWGT